MLTISKSPLGLMLILCSFHTVLGGGGQQPAQNKQCKPGCTDGLVCDNTSGLCVAKIFPSGVGIDFRVKSNKTNMSDGRRRKHQQN